MVSESSKIMEDLGEDESLFDQLPDHCLAHIFSFLPIRERLDSEKVCQRWCIISKEGWRDMKEIDIDHADCSEDEIRVIMKRCGRFLRKVNIFIEPSECKCLSIAIRYCPLDQLEGIGIMISGDNAIDENHLNMSNLIELFKETRNLVEVTIRGDLRYYRADHLNSLSVKILRIQHKGIWCHPVSINPDGFPNLKELYLEAVKIIEDEMNISFHSEAKKEENLKDLEIFDIGYSYISQNFIRKIRTFTNLRELCLRVNLCNIQDEHIRDIASHCYKIEKMILCGSCGMTTECFQYVGEMRSLEILTLEYFKNVNDSDILHLTNVYQLCIRECEISNDDGFLELIVNSSNLEKLQILDVDESLCRHFLEGVGRIFHRGQREKHLSLVTSVIGEVQSFHALKKEIEHPLLNLKVSSKPSRMMNHDDDL